MGALCCHDNPVKIRTLFGHEQTVNNLVTIKNTNGEYLVASCSNDSKIKLWNAFSDYNSLKGTLEGHEDRVTCLTTIKHMNEIYLVSGSDDNTIRVWDLSPFSLLKTINANSSVKCINTLNYQNGSAIVTASDKEMKLWNPFALNESYMFLTSLDNRGEHINCMTVLTLGGRHLIATGGGRVINIWDLNTERENKLAYTIKDSEEEDSTITCLSSFRPWFGEDVVVSGSGRKKVKIKIWNIAKEKLIKAFDAHDLWINAITSVRVNGEYLLASCGQDKKLKLWNPVLDEKLVKTYDEHEEAVTCIDTLEIDNHELMLTGSEDKTIKLWK